MFPLLCAAALAAPLLLDAPDAAHEGSHLEVTVHAPRAPVRGEVQVHLYAGTRLRTAPCPEPCLDLATPTRVLAQARTDDDHVVLGFMVPPGDTVWLQAVAWHRGEIFVSEPHPMEIGGRVCSDGAPCQLVWPDDDTDGFGTGTPTCACPGLGWAPQPEP